MISPASVVFDARTIGYPGIGRYVRELSSALLKAESPEAFAFLAPPGADVAFPGAADVRVARSKVYGATEQFEMPRLARGAVLFHAPHFNFPLFWRGKLVVTIHDLIYLRHRESLDSPVKRAVARFLIGAACRRADALIAVSEHTKKDILAEFQGTDASKITVIHEAASSAFRPADEEAKNRVRATYGIAGPFILFVGTLKPHKNLATLLSAMAAVRKEKGIRHTLVIAGRADDKHPEILGQVGAYSFARHIGEVSDEDLPALYSAAAAFVLPSLCEGFGLPVLEAMACGTPVIVSDASSLPEVAGSAAKSFDPLRVDALAEVLYTVLENHNLRVKMSVEGLDRARLFSWDAAAAQTLRVYEKVLS
jgi:glycosyltransferase involved in cell wall biosynthesis